MRARLLDATIECLDEPATARMSTNDVVRRARVSRGALAHHFPTKADLVSAAAQRLLDQRAAEFRERFEAIPPARRTPAEALDVLWSFYDSPGGIALIELTVAARHRPELVGVLSPMVERIAGLTGEVFAEYFPDLARLPLAEEALRAIHALFAGLALGALAGDDARAATTSVPAARRSRDLCDRSSHDRMPHRPVSPRCATSAPAGSASTTPPGRCRGITPTAT